MVNEKPVKPSIWRNSEIWQHGIFEFTLAAEVGTEIDSRGNFLVKEKKVKVTFKMQSNPSSRNSVQVSEPEAQLREIYSCNVVAVDGDDTIRKLPSGIFPGDIGYGSLNGRECRAEVNSIAQSSVSPITNRVMGAKCELLVHYNVRSGSSGI